MNIKVSVIVPVFNLEKVIGRCLKSIQNQTEKDIEVIIVDDGSSDNSIKIVETFLQDARFKLVRAAHAGVGEARNKGIRQACGEYVCFVDGDDYIGFNHIKKMVMTMQSSDVEMICTGWTVVEQEAQQKMKCSELYTRSLPNDIFDLKDIYERQDEENKDKIFHFIYALVNMGSWNKLFLRSIIIDKNIRFSSWTDSEDIYFNQEYMKYISRLQTIASREYYYVKYNDRKKRFISYEDRIKKDKQGLYVLAEKNRRNVELLRTFYTKKEINAFMRKYFESSINSLIMEGTDKIFYTIQKKKEYLRLIRENDYINERIGIYGKASIIYPGLKLLYQKKYKLLAISLPAMSFIYKIREAVRAHEKIYQLFKRIVGA